MAGPAYEFRSLTIAGDFTNPQIKGNYIDCTGATFSMYFYDTKFGAGYSYPVQGANFVAGEVSGEFYDGDMGGWVEYTISASPSQFMASGSQSVVFTATVIASGLVDPSPKTATKTVNVISPEPAEKIIIDAELYEELEIEGYTIIIPSNYSPSSDLMVSINEETPQNFGTFLNTNGRTITNCNTLMFTSANADNGVDLGRTYSGSSNDKFYLTVDKNWQFGTRTLTSGIGGTPEPSQKNIKQDYILFEFIKNITFTYFEITTYTPRIIPK